MTETEIKLKTLLQQAEEKARKCSLNVGEVQDLLVKFGECFKAFEEIRESRDKWRGKYEELKQRKGI